MFSLLYAVYTRPNAGVKSDQRSFKYARLVLGEKYEVQKVDMESWHTYIILKDYPQIFNSVNFSFEDENGNPIDIYSSPKYNPFL